MTEWIYRCNFDTDIAKLLKQACDERGIRTTIGRAKPADMANNPWGIVGFFVLADDKAQYEAQKDAIDTRFHELQRIYQNTP